MKKVGKIFLLFLSLVFFISPIVKVLAEPLKGHKQVTNQGGSNTNSKDGVTVSKTIKESDIENYFDITLTVETTSKIEEITKAQDLAVVIVMDISNTMNYGLTSEETTGDTRISVAKDSAKRFVEKFYDYSKNSNAIRQIGLVTFNRDANNIFSGLVDAKSTSLDTLNSNIDRIKAPSGNNVKWTNMEAGLKMANNLLNKTSVKNKYIIFLTDGLPTTYIKNNYTGYIPGTSNPDTSKGYTEGIFYNFQRKTTVSGTNYSEFGARKAELQAYNMKNNGIKIYSIGVGITGQSTLYKLQYKTTVDGYALSHTVDTDTEANNHTYTKNSTYKVPRYYTVLPGVNSPSKNATSNNNIKKLYNDTSYYKTWLSQYIGSDTIGSSEKKYYYDSDNKKALENAYDKIFEDIKEMTSQEISASWVAEDPMNANGVVKNIQFVGLYDDNLELKDNLNINNDNESDTATYNDNKDTLLWDLKNSTREEIKKTENGKEITYYRYEVKYRIRLQNELTDFIKDKSYLTNGKTSLDYVVIENVNGENIRSEKRTIEFPIPEVMGYLGELEFKKISEYDNSLMNGVKFRLVHDDKCTCMKERKHMDKDYYIEELSSEGIVKFENIPSGHSYKLYEVENDGLHEIDTNKYDVDVSYGDTTTNIKDKIIINKYKRRELEISKEVSGIETDREFNFLIEATYKDKKVEETYPIIRIDKNNRRVEDTITFIDGKITFNLANNEKIIIKDLPYMMSYTVKELNTDGYVVKYQINEGDIELYDPDKPLVNNLTDNITFKIINTSGYELPATGSSRMLILIIIGLLLLIGPVIYIGYDIYKGKVKLTF